MNYSPKLLINIHNDFIEKETYKMQTSGNRQYTVNKWIPNSSPR